MEEASIIGIDLAKRSFQVHGARPDGSVAYRRKVSRGKLLGYWTAMHVSRSSSSTPMR